MSDPAPLHAAADRNLLFGILAVQLDFVSRDALIAAMNAWVLDKTKPLGRILEVLAPLAARFLQPEVPMFGTSAMLLFNSYPTRKPRHYCGTDTEICSQTRRPRIPVACCRLTQVETAVPSAPCTGDISDN
jgi:hypothetical protein